jgi:hypothetical protein
MKPATAFLSASILSLLLGVGGAQAQGTADNTNSKSGPVVSYQDWLMKQSQTNHGYISRQAYMDEMGRRWDAMDADQHGLTPAQINSMYGITAPSPGEVKAPGPHTNPTGTEATGENSGGK